MPRAFTLYETLLLLWALSVTSGLLAYTLIETLWWLFGPKEDDAKR